jgi:hypothetical protein
MHFRARILQRARDCAPMPPRLAPITTAVSPAKSYDTTGISRASPDASTRSDLPSRVPPRL